MNEKSQQQVTRIFRVHARRAGSSMGTASGKHKGTTIQEVHLPNFLLTLSNPSCEKDMVLTMEQVGKRTTVSAPKARRLGSGAHAAPHTIGKKGQNGELV